MTLIEYPTTAHKGENNHVSPKTIAFDVHFFPENRAQPTFQSSAFNLIPLFFIKHLPNLLTQLIHVDRLGHHRFNPFFNVRIFIKQMDISRA